MEHVIQKKDIGLTAKKKSFFWSPVPLEVAKNPDTIFFSMKTVFFMYGLRNHLITLNVWKVLLNVFQPTKNHTILLHSLLHSVIQ